MKIYPSLSRRDDIVFKKLLIQKKNFEKLCKRKHEIWYHYVTFESFRFWKIFSFLTEVRKQNVSKTSGHWCTDRSGQVTETARSVDVRPMDLDLWEYGMDLVMKTPVQIWKERLEFRKYLSTIVKDPKQYAPNFECLCNDTHSSSICHTSVTLFTSF